LPKVPPIVVTLGSSEIAPIRITANAGARKNKPASWTKVNCSWPVSAIGDAISAHPARNIPTPTKRIDRFIVRDRAGPVADPARMS